MAQLYLSVSKYLAQLLQREVTNEWLKNYFEVFGSWEGEPLERASQGEIEIRKYFD